MENVIIIKRDINHRETWRYSGKIVKQNKSRITIKAFFNRSNMEFHGILLREGDLFIETFYTTHWYNVFAIYDCIDNSFKGLYCNISYPAVIDDGVVSYIDLALDLLVYPDGRQLTLDWDEFEKLALEPEIRQQAKLALEKVKRYTIKVLPRFV